MRKKLDESYVIAILKDAIDVAGSQKAFARKHNMSEQYVSDVVLRRRGIGDKILLALQLRRIVTFEKIQQVKGE